MDNLDIVLKHAKGIGADGFCDGDSNDSDSCFREFSKRKSGIRPKRIRSHELEGRTNADACFVCEFFPRCMPGKKLFCVDCRKSGDCFRPWGSGKKAFCLLPIDRPRCGLLRIP